MPRQNRARYTIGSIHFGPFTGMDRISGEVAILIKFGIIEADFVELLGSEFRV